MANERLSKTQLRLILDHRGIDGVYEIYQSLTDRIEELERRLGMNSRNSSKPPSTDICRPKPKSQREKSGKKTGGQPGHPGHTLKKADTPDEIHELSLPDGPLCASGCTRESSTPLAPEVRQVADIPEIRLRYHEYRAQRVLGLCGHIHCAGFPEGISAPVQYGSRIKAAALYLSAYHLVPQERTTAALSDLFGAPISEGTLNSIIGHAHSRLESTSEAIQAALSAEAVVGLDETGSFYNGTRWWQHTVSSDQYTHYGFHPRRGLEGTEWSSPFLVQYCGITIHDAWAPYFQLPKAGHALCNAHHLRQLKGVFETTGQSWASRMQRLLRAVRDEVSEARDRGLSSLSETRRAYWIKRYRRIITSGLKENPLREPPAGRARVRQSVARRLLEQLRDREKETLAFMSDFRIRFDNNQAERDLRMTKVKQKVSGCFRSVTGAKAFFRIRGYILTLQKQGADVFEYLIQVFTPGTPDVLLPQA